MSVLHFTIIKLILPNKARNFMGLCVVFFVCLFSLFYVVRVCHECWFVEWKGFGEKSQRPNFNWMNLIRNKQYLSACSCFRLCPLPQLIRLRRNIWNDCHSFRAHSLCCFSLFIFIRHCQCKTSRRNNRSVLELKVHYQEKQRTSYANASNTQTHAKPFIIAHESE